LVRVGFPHILEQRMNQVFAHGRLGAVVGGELLGEAELLAEEVGRQSFQWRHEIGVLQGGAICSGHVADRGIAGKRHPVIPCRELMQELFTPSYQARGSLTTSPPCAWSLAQRLKSRTAMKNRNPTSSTSIHLG